MTPLRSIVTGPIGVGFDWELDDIATSTAFAAEVVDVDAFGTSAETALTEDAFAQGWQTSFSGYVTLGKPVFAVEYTDETRAVDFHSTVCSGAKALGYKAILKPRDLTASVERCP